jgi:hypothetical protein
VHADDQAVTDVLPAQLAFPPHNHHSTNVVTVPQLCEHHLAVGMYDGPDRQGRLRLLDILVAADSNGFRFYAVVRGVVETDIGRRRNASTDTGTRSGRGHDVRTGLAAGR